MAKTGPPVEVSERGAARRGSGLPAKVRSEPKSGHGQGAARADATIPSKAMIRFEDILETVESYNSHPDEELLRRAYVFSAKEHKGQVRLSGEPYLIHPLNVALTLARMRLDETSIAVGLLHDVLEDTLTTREALAEFFSEEIAHLVDGVTKISKYQFESKEEQQAESFRKMLLASVDDVRVILVKLADRLHNMQTLDHMPPPKRRKVARETLDIYAPIANRLGMGHLKGELEDLSFRHLHPDEFEDLRQRVERQMGIAGDVISRIETNLREKLAAASIAGRVRGRVKRLASIWSKLRRQEIETDRIYDYLAFRIVVGSVHDCYAALGTVHQAWRPVPGRFKDYIAVPKPNGYQSLHTTVFGDAGTPFEIQIRTEEMDELAERGIAAHWKYKEGKLTPAPEDERYRWLRQLVELSSESRDSRQFLQNLKIDLYPDEVYAFTPKGEIFAFPRGATPLDFAFRIHTEVGHHCTGARVNGKQVPLKTPLQNGDIVEISTQPTAQPSRDWLAFVVTARARSKIRHFIQGQQKTRLVDLGRRLLDRELHRHKAGLRKVLDGGLLEAQLSDLGYSRLDDLFADIGSGKVPARSLVPRLLPEVQDEAEPSRPEGMLGRVVRRILPFRGASAPVAVQGSGDLLTYLARCCSPVPGEAIVGYITRGRGVAIHAESCANVRSLAQDAGRRIQVDWGDRKETAYSVSLAVRCREKPGILAAVTQAISSAKANILQIEARVDENREGRVEARVEVTDSAHLDRLLASIRSVSGVVDVERKVGGRSGGRSGLDRRAN